ncbi:sporulation protein YunB [Mahella sp.]|uniref:sporulation protein YunB n=1 Tax=Mahella sp. TaxID=2798721 RepID=UPI0025BD4724|nr:sporulation protein YunB [Mahella sp.]MBZ4665703.1 sporulation protein YunB [Mahella sp.]
MYRLYGSKKRHKWNLFIVLIVAVVMFALVFEWIDRSIAPTVLALSSAKARVIATQAINVAVNKKLADGISYDQLITAITDDNGRVTMLQANTMRMNKLGSETALAVLDEMKSVSSTIIKVPIGSVLGGDILAGRGPYINIKILPVGSVVNDFVTEFENAGINQTRHKIYLRVKAHIKVVIPLNSQELEVVSQVPIAETVIVGNVPQSYVNLQEPDAKSDALNLLPDLND